MITNNQRLQCVMAVICVYLFLIFVIVSFTLSGNSQNDSSTHHDLDLLNKYRLNLSETIIFTAEEGEECNLSNGKLGVCTPLNECDERTNSTELKIAPKICKIEEQNVFICCEEEEEISNVKSSDLNLKNTASVKSALEINERNIICMKKNGIKGLCRPISDCEDDPEEVLQTGNVDVCGFSKNDECPKICCENPYLRPGESDHYFIDVKPYNIRRASNGTTQFLFDTLCNATYNTFIKPYIRRKVVPKKRNDTCYLQRHIYAEGLGIGGVDAPPYKYPHMVALGFDTAVGIKYLCGGTLITTKIVLTAAHCLWSKEFGPIKHARLGIVNINDDRDSKEDRIIIRRERHPDYNPKRKYHDIAIVELNEPVELKPFGILPACVDTGMLKPNTELTATGWGKIGFTGPPADHLQELFIRIYDHSECQKFYGVIKSIPQGIVDNLQICAGRLNVDTCEGDSGGPLQYSLENYKYFSKGFLVVGITSFGKPCALTGAPGVYTRVSAYLDWLASVIFI